MSSLKKVLVITYYWPPSGGAGVQRWLKFCKFLPEFGYEPVVITVDPAYATYPVKDETLEAEVSADLEVHRTKTFELYNVYKVVTGKKEAPYAGFANEAETSFTQKVSRFVRGNFMLPDARKGWNKYAIKKAGELIAKGDIAAVITTSPPHSTQLIGEALQKKHGIPWLADLRDPWTEIYYYHQLAHTEWAKKKDLALERRVLEGCDAAVTVSNGFKRMFKTKTDKGYDMAIIPNGYDEGDFRYEYQRTDKYTITYTGTIADTYNVDGLVSALKAVNDVRLRFYGKVSPKIKRRLEAELPNVEIALMGYVSHDDAVKAVVEADLLLLIIPEVTGNDGILPGKIYEYLRSRTPVLCIAPVDSDAATIVTSCGAGFAADYADNEKMLTVFQSELDKYSKGISARTIDAGLQYERKRLTQEMAKVLDQMKPFPAT